MFWIKLLITLIDIFFIFNGAKLVINTTGTVLDLAAGHEMTAKKWSIAALLMTTGVFLLAMVYPLSHMLTGNSPVDPILTGASIAIASFVYKYNIV